jgi:hypothetical protein
MRLAQLVAIPLALAATLGCVTGPSPASLSRPGFYTEVKDGRLWVLRDGSKDLEEFKKHRELAKQVTRIGAGPDGMTIKSSDAEIIDAYLAAK